MPRAFIAVAGGAALRIFTSRLVHRKRALYEGRNAGDTQMQMLLKNCRYDWCVCVLAGLFFIVARASSADFASFPIKPIRIVVAFAPGGGTDIVARMLAKQLTELYKQQVFVDNRPGAAGTLGADLVAKSAADGYTLLLTVNALAANSTLYAKLPFDTIKDFSAIALIGATPNALAVHPALPAKTAKDFVALAKAKPDQIAYASTGTGGAAFLATEMFKMLTNIHMLHVPYKGAGPALIGILSGEAQAIIAALPPTVPYIRRGKLRALGITSEKRASLAPELPTLIEAGIKGMVFETWYGLFAPAAVPREIVSKLNASIITILASRDFTEQLARQGIEPAGGTPESFDRFFHEEIDRLGKVIRASGAQPE
jgi:tripartite-type tricarboxylate transporter receptor subunit TctC